MAPSLPCSAATHLAICSDRLAWSRLTRVEWPFEGREAATCPQCGTTLTVATQPARLMTVAWQGDYYCTWSDEYGVVETARYRETDSGVEFVDSDSLRRLPADLIDQLLGIVSGPCTCWTAGKVVVR